MRVYSGKQKFISTRKSGFALQADFMSRCSAKHLPRLGHLRNFAVGRALRSKDGTQRLRVVTTCRGLAARMPIGNFSRHLDSPQAVFMEYAKQ